MENRTKKLSKNIKQLRNDNELSTSQMAKRLRISKTDYENLEKGVLSSTIGVDILFYAEHEFGIMAHELLM